MALKVTNHADVEQIIASVRALSENKVLVGVPATTTDRQGGVPGKSGKPPINNAEIAYIQNFGSPKARIPAREFMYSGLETAKPRIINMLKVCADQAMLGNRGATIAGLHAVGIVAQNAIRAKISAGPFVPLAPLTIARRRRGDLSRYNELTGAPISSADHVSITGVKPLIDTGALRRAITYVLRGSWF